MLKTTATTAASTMPQEPGMHSFLKIVGSSTYKVNVYFDGVNRETAENKLLRCVRHDANFSDNLAQNVLQTDQSAGGSL